MVIKLNVSNTTVNANSRDNQLQDSLKEYNSSSHFKLKLSKDFDHVSLKWLVLLQFQKQLLECCLYKHPNVKCSKAHYNHLSSSYHHLISIGFLKRILKKSTIVLLIILA